MEKDKYCDMSNGQTPQVNHKVQTLFCNIKVNLCSNWNTLYLQAGDLYLSLRYHPLSGNEW